MFISILVLGRLRSQYYSLDLEVSWLQDRASLPGDGQGDPFKTDPWALET